VSFTAGELNAKLGLSTSEFDSKVDASGRKLQALDGKVRGIASKIGGVLKGVALTGAVAFAGGLVAAAVAGIKYNSTIQQTTIAMGTMLHSTSKAKALIADVAKLAAKTPFEFPELADATKRLVAYGFAQKVVVGSLTRLGDIASALGIPLTELADLYGKAKVQGRLYAEDVMQFAGRGVPIFQALGKVMGVAASKVRDLVEDGKVGFPELEKAIKSLTGQGSMFGGMMDKQSKSFAGLWSTVKDNATQIFGMVMRPAFDWLVKEGFPKAISMLDKFSAGWKKAGMRGGLASVLGSDKAGKIMAFLNGVKDVTTTVADVVGKVASGFASLPGSIQKAILYVGLLAAALKTAGLLAPAAGAVTGAVKGAVSSLAGAGAAGAAAGAGAAATGTAGGAGVLATAASMAPLVAAAAAAVSPVVIAAVMQKTQTYAEGREGAAATSQQNKGAGGAFYGSSRGYGGGGEKYKDDQAAIAELTRLFDQLTLKSGMSTKALERTWQTIDNIKAAARAGIDLHIGDKQTLVEMYRLRSTLIRELDLTGKEADDVLKGIFGKKYKIPKPDDTAMRRTLDENTAKVNHLKSRLDDTGNTHVKPTVDVKTTGLSNLYSVKNIIDGLKSKTVTLNILKDYGFKPEALGGVDLLNGPRAYLAGEKGREVAGFFPLGNRARSRELFGKLVQQLQSAGVLESGLGSGLGSGFGLPAMSRARASSKGAGTVLGGSVTIENIVVNVDGGPYDDPYEAGQAAAEGAMEEAVRQARGLAFGYA
jgi:tape measure domain-containing protein